MSPSVPPWAEAQEAVRSTRLLGGDAGVFHERWEKSAAGLVAVATALRRGPDVVAGAKEFLASYDRVVALPPAAFTSLWRDPMAYFWLHRAYELVGAVLAGENRLPALAEFCRALGAATPAQALTRHLRDFERFAVAAHLLAGVPCTLAAPLTVTVPFVLPGTGLFLDGRESVAIGGTAPGALVLAAGAAAPPRELEVPEVPVDAAVAANGDDAVRLARSPVARHGACTLRLQPYALAHPGLDVATAAVDAGPAYHERHRGLVEDALSLVARYDPPTFAALAEVMQVVALKPASAGGFTNLSHSDLPGACVLGVVQHPFDVADALVHEYHHNRLFCIEEAGSFFAVPEDGNVECYYSPWRDDPRTLRGLLHGLYVFVPVCGFWLAVHDAGDSSADVAAWAADQIVRIPAQLELAIDELRTHARFSALGAELFGELQKARAAIAGRIQERRLPSDAPAYRCTGAGAIERERRPLDGRFLSALESVAEHRQRFGAVAGATG